jgi:ABC-type phosphate/phosphonate transport system permease subunit
VKTLNKFFFSSGFDSDAGKFFTFSLTLIQVSVLGCSYAFLFSATFGIFAVANLMAAVLYTVMLVRMFYAYSRAQFPAKRSSVG